MVPSNFETEILKLWVKRAKCFSCPNLECNLVYAYLGGISEGYYKIGTTGKPARYFPHST